MKVLILDTETSGLPIRADEYAFEQPWPLSIGAVLFDLKTGNNYHELNTIVVPPEGVIFNEKAVEIHGLTEERVRSEGRDMLETMLELRDMANEAKIIGAYNLAFDERIVRTSSVRLHPDFEEAPVLGSHAMHLCVMQQAMAYFGTRQKLTTIYRKLTGKALEGAHDAMADTVAAKEVFRILTAKQLSSKK